MTSANTSSVKKYSASKFYGYKFRSNLHILALFLILTIIIMMIPCVLSLNGTHKQIVNIRNAYSIDPVTLMPMDSVNTSDSDDQAAAAEEDIKSFIKSEVIGYSIVGIVLGGIFAVIGGMCALSYVNEKKSVGCYHSFPLRRETIYLTETSIYAIYYFISAIVGYIGTYFILSSNFPYVSDYAGIYFGYMLGAVALFLVGYTMIIFIGGLTGTNVMKFILTGLYIGIGAALYFLIVFMFLCGALNLDENYYLNIGVMNYICAPYRFFNAVCMVEELDFHLFLYLIPDVVVCFVGGLFLHKYRKSERTGTTIIWKPVFAVVKYLVIFIAAMLGVLIFGGGLFFGYGGSAMTVQMLVGAGVGALIAYLVSNALLYRSPKFIFKDIKGFGIALAAIAVFVLLVPANITGLIGKPYSKNFTSKISVIYDSTTDEKNYNIKIPDEYTDEILDTLITEDKLLQKYNTIISAAYPYSSVEHYDEEFKNDEEFRAWYEEWCDKYGIRQPTKIVGVTDYDKVMIDVCFKEHDFSEKYWRQTGLGVVMDDEAEYMTPTASLTVVQYPYIGIPLAKNINVPVVNLWNKVTRSPEYAEYMNENLKNRGTNYVSTYISVDVLNNYNSYIRIDEDSLKYNESARKLKKYIDEYEYSGEKRDDYPLIATMMIGSKTYPVYADDYGFVHIADMNDREIIAKYGSDEQAAVYEERGNYAFPEVHSTNELYEEYMKQYEAAMLVDTETGEAVSISETKLRELIPKLASLSWLSAWNEDFSFIDPADTKYVMITAKWDNTAGTLYFRDGAVDDEYLAELFEYEIDNGDKFEE